MKSIPKSFDIRTMGIRATITSMTVKLRTELIRTGVGRKYFLSSQNPVVRAAAFCSRMTSQTTIRQLAMAIHTDCLDGERIHEPAAEVYRVHFQKFRLDPGECNFLASNLYQVAEAKEDIEHAVLISDLLKYLNIYVTR